VFGGIGAQPRRDARRFPAIPGGVFDGQLGKQRFGQWVIPADRHKAQLVHGVKGHHLNV
jgi:hypothetical protein